MGKKRIGWARMKSLINENENRLNHKRPAFKKGTATVSLTQSESGQCVIVGPLAAGLAGDVVFTLPTAENGLYFKFVYVGGAADAQDFQLNTGSDTNYFIGGIFQHDIGGEDGAAYHPNLSSNSKINFLTPDAGTFAEVWCDGTNWFVNGFLNSATNTGITFADQ
jgi:hypothetical protein